MDREGYFKYKPGAIFYFVFKNNEQTFTFKINNILIQINAKYTFFSSNIHCSHVPHVQHTLGGGEIAQSLESLSTKRAIRVRAHLNPLVLERWNSITVLVTCSHQCRRLVKKRQSMCYCVCVIMHVKDP